MHRDARFGVAADFRIAQFRVAAPFWGCTLARPAPSLTLALFMAEVGGSMLETRKLLTQLAGLGAWVLMTASAAAPDTSRYVPPPQGSTWTYRIANSGSFGSGNQQTTRTMTTGDWQGRKLLLVDDKVLMHTHLDEQGCWHGDSRGNSPVFAGQPPRCGAKRPYAIGETTTEKFSIYSFSQNQSYAGEGTITVEAYEAVVVPAGKFMAFRIRSADTFGNERVSWVSQELGINVKWQHRRKDGHWAGPGTQEVELLSHTIRR